MSNVAEVTADTFEAEVLKSEIPVLLDLYADWCMPCRIMGTMLDQLAPQLQGRVKIMKVNVDEEQELAAAMRVSNIPMLVLFKDGRVVAQSVGAVPASAVLKMIGKAA